MPDTFWRLDSKRTRNKVQHEITELLDSAEINEASSLSHDPAVNAQFRGSITPSMSLPFNSCLIPRHILDRLRRLTPTTFPTPWRGTPCYLFSTLPFVPVPKCGTPLDCTRPRVFISMPILFYTIQYETALLEPRAQGLPRTPRPR
jgi:hypothetical protein